MKLPLQTAQLIATKMLFKLRVAKGTYVLNATGALNTLTHKDTSLTRAPKWVEAGV